MGVVGETPLKRELEELLHRHSLSHGCTCTWPRVGTCMAMEVHVHAPSLRARWRAAEQTRTHPATVGQSTAPGGVLKGSSLWLSESSRLDPSGQYCIPPATAQAFRQSCRVQGDPRALGAHRRRLRPVVVLPSRVGRRQSASDARAAVRAVAALLADGARACLGTAPTPTLVLTLIPTLVLTLAPALTPSLAPSLASLAPTLTPSLASLAPSLAPSLALPHPGARVFALDPEHRAVGQQGGGLLRAALRLQPVPLVAAAHPLAPPVHQRRRPRRRPAPPAPRTVRR